MELKDYKVIYEAKEGGERIFKAAPKLPGVDAKTLKVTNKEDGTEYKLADFKFIYDNGKNLMGILKSEDSNVPTANDIALVIKDEDGKVVLGEEKAQESGQQAKQQVAKKASKKVVEEVVEEKVEEI